MGYENWNYIKNFCTHCIDCFSNQTCKPVFLSIKYGDFHRYLSDFSCSVYYYRLPTKCIFSKQKLHCLHHLLVAHKSRFQYRDSWLQSSHNYLGCNGLPARCSTSYHLYLWVKHLWRKCCWRKVKFLVSYRNNLVNEPNPKHQNAFYGCFGTLGGAAFWHDLPNPIWASSLSFQSV